MIVCWSSSVLTFEHNEKKWPLQSKQVCHRTVRNLIGLWCDDSKQQDPARWVLSCCLASAVVSWTTVYQRFVTLILFRQCVWWGTCKPLRALVQFHTLRHWGRNQAGPHRGSGRAVHPSWRIPVHTDTQPPLSSGSPRSGKTRCRPGTCKGQLDHLEEWVNWITLVLMNGLLQNSPYHFLLLNHAAAVWNY